jgi:hypothetical protein
MKAFLVFRLRRTTPLTDKTRCNSSLFAQAVCSNPRHKREESTPQYRNSG